MNTKSRRELFVSDSVTIFKGYLRQGYRTGQKKQEGATTQRMIRYCRNNNSNSFTLTWSKRSNRSKLNKNN